MQPTTTLLDLPLQPASADIWDSKYRLKRADGTAVDADVEATLRRVAHALAAVERDAGTRAHWADRFLWAMRRGAIPAGRILANAGADALKPATSTINCTVSGGIADSMDSILGRLHEAGITLKAGCGIGYEFSTLRPRGAFVAGAGAHTSGPLSFMDVYDKMCFTISSAGDRRGAQMAVFDVQHPDVLEFIGAKREDGRLRQFNLSLLITHDFLHAVRNNRDWQLTFPVTQKEVDAGRIDTADRRQVLWRHWPVDDAEYVRDAEGHVATRIYKTLPARVIWDAIMRSTFEFSEPGFILIDTINEMNNNWFCEDIRATNPCGEQPLPPYGACLLGSIDLTRFVRAPFSADASFDWNTFREVVDVFTRMLDNVADISGLPLAEQQHEIRNKRRHGMGFLGLGSALTLLGLRYGSPGSLAFTEQVSRELAVTGWRAGLALAKEKGAAPVLQRNYKVTATMLAKRPEMTADGIQVGDELPGRMLHAKYSRYMQRIAAVDPDLVEQLAAIGSRFTHHSSIAPTGTIALSIANNVSNGIEPSFAHHYSRNVLRAGRKSKEKVDVYSFELLAYRALRDAAALPADNGGAADAPADPSANANANADTHALPDYFVTSDAITPDQHIQVQAAAQRWIDSSISKTINVPSAIDFESFKDVYLAAADAGLKGCTTFRFNPTAFQGVLVQSKDLRNTVYEFTLDSGETVTVRGNDDIDYDGERHSAANLFDALKEGYYGKH